MTMIEARTNQQWAEAKRKADHVRLYRAQIRRDLRDGTLKVDDVILSRDRAMQGVLVVDLIVKRYYPQKAMSARKRYILGRDLGHLMLRTLGELTDRQRDELVTVLRALEMC